MDWQRRVHCTRDVIGHPPYGHGVLKLAQKHFYLFYKVRILIHIPYIKVIPGYFLSFETFVLFPQAPDEGN